MHGSHIRSLLLIPSIVLGAVQAQARAYTIGPVPDWVIVHDAGEARISDTTCVSGGMEMLVVDRQYNLATQEVYYKQVVRLVSADGVQQGSRFSADFDPSYQRLAIHSLRIIRNGKPLERLLPDRLRSLRREKGMDSYLYDGSITVVSDLQDVRVGDEVEYAYTITGWDPTDDGRFQRYIGMAFSEPVGFCYTRIIVPKGRSVHFRTTNGAAPGQEERTARGVEHGWTSKDLECVQVDGGAPGWYNGYPALEVSEFRDVAELRAWAVKLFRVDMRLRGELADRVRDLKLITDPLDRMDSAVRMVQQEVRYLGFENGIGAYRPHPPSVVFDQRFGDCKDKSLLLVDVLRACGIQAAPALVNSTYGKRLNALLPRPGMFDHCIVRAEQAGRTYWLDPTMINNGGHAADRYTPDYGYALVIGPGGKGLERMTVNDTGGVYIRERLELAAAGTSAELTAEVRYSGRFADAMRNSFASTSMAELQHGYTNYYAKLYGPCEVLSPLTDSFDPDLNVFTTNEHYRIPNAWDTLNDGRTLQFAITASGMHDYLALPAKPRRNAPYALGKPFHLEQRVEVVLPEVWQVDTFSHRISGFGINFSASAQYFDKTAIFEYAYSSGPDHVDTADAAAFYAQQHKINDHLGYNFTWRPKRDLAQAPAQGGFLGKALLVLFLILCIAVAAALYHYDPPADDSIEGQAGGKAIGGFLILPAIGLCIAPFIGLFAMFKDGGAFFAIPASLRYLYPGHALGMVLYGLFSQYFIIGLFVFRLLLAILFFKRRTSLPRLFKSFYIIMAVGFLVDAGIYGMLDLGQLSGTPYPVRGLFQALVGAAIWIPVFHFSERVKRTFVVRRHKPQDRPWPASEGAVPVPVSVDVLPPVPLPEPGKGLDSQLD